jgi:hypothetical protein
MKYMLLIYGDEQAAIKATPEQLKAQSDAYDVFTKSIVATGQFLDGDPFLPTSTAKTVAVRDAETSTTPGPFESTRQQLLAYYKVEAADESQALDMAARIPGAATGTIEVRPVMTFD